MPWSTGGLLGTVSLNKTDSPTPSSHQLSMTPQMTLELHAQLPPPCWTIAWLELLKVLCRLLQMAWVHMCNCPAVSERQCFITIVHHLWLCSYSVPSAVMMAEPWLGMGWDADVPLRAEYFIVSYSLLVLGGAHYNSITWEAEAGESGAQGHLQPHRVSSQPGLRSNPVLET